MQYKLYSMYNKYSVIIGNKKRTAAYHAAVSENTDIKFYSPFWAFVTEFRKSS